MRNKILLIVLSLTIALNIVCVNADAQTSDYDIEAVKLLSKLGIMEERTNITDYSQFVTRADFAIYVGRLITINEYDKANLSYFSDVSAEHWAANSINYLHDMGIISSGDEFRPDDYITSSEAAKMLLELTGYGVYAQNRGGFPIGYLTTAKETGIFKNTYNSEIVSYAQAVSMIFNASRINIYEAVSIGEYKNSYEVSEYKNLLSIYHGIYTDEGQLTDVDSVSLTKYKRNKGTMLINNTEYLSGSISNAVQFLGEKVRLYYTIDKSNEIKTAVMLSSISQKSELLNISVNKDFSFNESKYEISYTLPNSNGKINKQSISKNVCVIKNGMNMSDNIKKALSLTKGDLKLIDTDRNGEYDIIVAREYVNITVGYIDIDEKTVYDKFSSNRSFDFEEDSSKSVVYKSVDNKELNFEDIDTENLLTVYYSENYVEVIVSQNSFSGTIIGIDNSSDTIVDIDGVSYVVDSDWLEESGVTFSVGDKRDFITDIFGNIAYATDIKNSLNGYGYIINTANAAGIDDRLQIKMFISEGEIVTFDCASTVKVDGKAAKGTSAVVQALSRDKGKVQGLLVGYTKNSDGFITGIDTPYKSAFEDDGTLVRDVSESSQKFYYDTKMIGPKIMTKASKTIIMAVPSDTDLATADEEMFAIVSSGNFSDGMTYQVESYKLHEDEGIADFVIVKGDINESFKKMTGMFLVTKILKGINDKGEEHEILSGCREGLMLEIPVSAHYSLISQGIKQGDLIQYYINSNGEIISTTLLYSYSPDKKAPDWAPRSSSYVNTHNVTHGYVSSITKDNVIKIRHEGSDVVNEIGNLSSIIAIVVFDPSRKSNPVYVGNKYDLKASDDVGMPGSTVFISTRYAVMRWLVVYK